MQQKPAFGGLSDMMNKKQTPPELLLTDMDAAMPWCRLQVLIEPH